MTVPRDLVDKCRAIKSEHKAIGVVCFGYFRYRNARFGCAEVHQAIQCLGRQGMTLARQVAQKEGFEVVHTLTDCTFLHKPGVTRADALRIARRITREVGVPMDVEGVYKWIVFLPSKTHSTASEVGARIFPGESAGKTSPAGLVGVPNRYYGKFEDGTLKVRGIEVQRHSTPEWIYDAQQAMLDVFQRADDAAGFRARIPEALAAAKAAAEALRRREVAPASLGIVLQSTRGVDEYVANTNTRAALERLRDVGAERHPGEYVKYVITRRTGPWAGRVVPIELLDRASPWFSEEEEEGGGPRPPANGDARSSNAVVPYDVNAYLRLLARSVETMLSPFGYTEEGLYAWLSGAAPGPREEDARLDVVPEPGWVRTQEPIRKPA